MDSELESKREPERKGKKKTDTSTIFLLAVYALSMMFIILVVCGNFKS
ncbi:MAG TPA: hypothetical protein VN456_03060 [Desulfosporosinus sp.]|nr:hypothetical protein [Desulfosporosinus sp.]